MRENKGKILKNVIYCVNITVKGCPNKLLNEICLDEKREVKPAMARKGFNMTESCERIKPSIKKAKTSDAQNSRALFVNLNGKTAEQLISEYSLDKSIPVNLGKVLKSNNIVTRATNFNNLEKQPVISIETQTKGEILGAVIADNENINILFKEDDSYHRQKFTIAHELAHCCLHADRLAQEGHIEYRLDIEENEGDEYNANRFAGELLIPKTLLNIVYKNLSNPNLNVLAKLFDVSSTVMKARLDVLGYPYTQNPVLRED